MANLASLKPAKGARKNKKREGRGHAGYCGKTAGKGMNGQKARSGVSIRKGFEGGQTPLYRRLPKKQFIAAFSHKEYTVINVATLEELVLDEISPEILLEEGVIKKLENAGLKILGNGDIKRKITVKTNAISASAKEKIEAAGGSVEII